MPVRCEEIRGVKILPEVIRRVEFYTARSDSRPAIPGDRWEGAGAEYDLPESSKYRLIQAMK